MARLICALGLLLALAMSGCGNANSPQGIVNEMATVRQEIGAAIDGVTDEASAGAALPKIEAGVVKLNGLDEKFSGVEKTVSPDGLQRLKAQMTGSGAELESKKAGLATRNEKAYKIVLDAMMGQAMVCEITAGRREIGAAMDGAKDEATGSKAAATIGSVVDRLNEIGERLGPLEKELLPDTLERFKSQLNAASADMETKKAALAGRSEAASKTINDTLGKLK